MLVARLQKSCAILAARHDLFSQVQGRVVGYLFGQVLGTAQGGGIVPNDVATTRRLGALLLEQNNEWAVQRARSMPLQNGAFER